MKPKHQRLLLAGLAIAAVLAAVLLAMWGLRDRAAYFFTPVEIAIGKAELRPKRLRPLRPDILADGPRAFPLAKEDIAEPRLAFLVCPRIHAVAESA